MTIQQLRYVLGVADSGSFNKASEKLFISQPSLTSSVHDLEYELGFSIFNRTARGTTATEKGNLFISDARLLYQNYENLVRKYTVQEKKSFSVSTLYYAFARRAFVEVVKKFAPEGYDFSFREMKALDVIHDVENGKSEVGIIYVSDVNRAEILKTLNDFHLAFHHLTECNAFVCLYKNHPLAEKESLSLEELSDYHFVTYDADDLNLLFSEKILKRREFAQSITVVDRATVLNLLRTLDGYTFLSGVLSENNDGDYILIPLKDIDNDHVHTFELGYITQNYTKMSPISLTYIDTIRRILHIEGFSC